MKKESFTLLVIVSLVCTAMFIGCDKEEVSYLTIDNKEIVLSPETTKASFNIKSNTDWSITSPDIEVGYGVINYKSWYELDKIGGTGNGNVTVLVKENAAPAENQTVTLIVNFQNKKKTESFKETVTVKFTK